MKNANETLGQRAPNSRWVDGITFKGRLYPGPYALHATAAPSKRVSVQTFSSRVSARAAFLDDEVIEECLYLPSKEYQAKYSPRITWIELDGVKLSANDLFETLSKPLVSYPNFRQRLKRLERAGRLSIASIEFAGVASEEGWQDEHGGGKRTPFTYNGEDYLDLIGITFPSIAAFLKRIGRYNDRYIVRRRLLVQWDIDAALTEPALPATDRSGRIYKITRLSNGQSYVGLTLLDPSSRFAQHKRKAMDGSMTPLHKAIRTDGIDGFVIDVLEDGLLAGEVGEREKYWISALATLCPSGLNKATGGQVGGGKSKPTVYEGEEFPSMDAAAETLGKRHNLAKHVVVKRLQTGKPLPLSARKNSNHIAAGSGPWRRWKSMINRVDKKGEGALDPVWRDYDRYIADVGMQPVVDYQLLRLDCQLPWGPGNFEWASPQKKIQQQHGRAIIVFGIKYPSWNAVAQQYGIGASTLKHRVLQRGLTLEQAVSAPLGVTSRKYKPVFTLEGREFPSVTAAAKHIASETGEPVETVRYRLRKLQCDDG
jgi:hypothetical protein